jgi:hypothetical protein
MKGMNDDALAALREKRERMEALAGQVIDLMDSDRYSKASFKRMNKEYEALLEEFGQHGLALLDTIDDLQAQLQAERMGAAQTVWSEQRRD